jgi:hypothetical protein
MRTPVAGVVRGNGVRRGDGGATEKIYFNGGAHHGSVVEAARKNVSYQTDQHPERIFFTGRQQQQRDNEVHSLTVTNFGVENAVC